MAPILDETLETKTQLCRMIPLKGVALDHVKYSLVPVENTARNFGFVIAQNYVDKAQRLCLEYVDYARIGKNPLKLRYREINVTRRGDLFIIESEQGEVFPLPSLVPYDLCEITEGEYTSLKNNLGNTNKRKLRYIADMAIDILVKRANLSKVTQGFPGFRRPSLRTPVGYADQESRWYDMIDRLKPYLVP